MKLTDFHYLDTVIYAVRANINNNVIFNINIKSQSYMLFF